MRWKAGPRLGSMLLVAFAAGTSCAAPSSPEASVQPLSSAGSASSPICEPVDLLTPGGNRLDLTGTWLSGEALIVVQQFGDCVWMESLSRDERFPLGSAFRRLYFGQVRTDFTIVARFGNVHFAGAAVQAGHTVLSEGTVVCEIAFATDSGAERVTLRVPKVESVESGVWPLLDYVRVSSDTVLLSDIPVASPE